MPVDAMAMLMPLIPRSAGMSLSKTVPGDHRQLFVLFGERNPQFVEDSPTSLALRWVPGHDGRTHSCQLHDELSQVGFEGFDTDRGEPLLKAPSLPDHRFPFNDRFDIVLPGNVEDDLIGVFGVARPEDRDPFRFELSAN